MLKTGFMDVDEAKAYAAQRRAKLGAIRCVDNANRRITFKPTPIRQYSRICIPNVLISRGIRALTAPVRRITTPLSMAGPEMAKRLELRVARLDGISSRSRLQQIELTLALWLLEEPDSEPEATECGPHPDQAWLIAEFGKMDFPPRKQRPFSGGVEGAVKHPASDPQETAQAVDAPQNHKSRGVR